MTQTETPVVWQRVPQGWIELAAFANDDIADRWWQAYLAPAIGSVGSDTIALMTRAFASAREAVRDTPYAVAGIFPYLVDEPMFVVALSLDPNRLDELVPYAALALDSTRLLSADEMPAPYPPEDRLVATDAED